METFNLTERVVIIDILHRLAMAANTSDIDLTNIASVFNNTPNVMI